MSKPNVAARYENLPDPTAKEVAAGADAIVAQEARPVRPTIRAEAKDGRLDLSNPHKDGLEWQATLQETFGTCSQAFVDDAIGKLISVTSRCDGDGGTALNASLALIGGVAPEDEAQAAIALQIAVAHSASVHMTGRAMLNATAGHREAAASYVGMATKFSRTMVAHVEALTKLRGGGRQIVEHRYINVNGNAVVGDHAQTIIGGTPQGVENGNQNQSHAKLDHVRAPLAPMPCPEPRREALPVTGGEGTETMQDARRNKPRRAPGSR